MPPLANIRHERFCLNLLGGMSLTQAYIEAGYSKGGADKSGSNLKKNHLVFARLEELQRELDVSRVASVQERRERLTEIIRARFPDFHNADGRPVALTHEVPNIGAVAEIAQEYDDGAEMMVVSKVKLHDPLKAVDLLNKMGGDYPPSKMEVSGHDGGPIRVEDARERLASAITRISPRDGEKGADSESEPAGS